MLTHVKRASSVFRGRILSMGVSNLENDDVVFKYASEEHPQDITHVGQRPAQKRLNSLRPEGVGRSPKLRSFLGNTVLQDHDTILHWRDFVDPEIFFKLH